ncbi:YeaH/YhbH family protein [Lutibaculum baratangense]|uniref:UPF0229 protein N177_3056 n=1 Tax=Lutibaculum baratangense AMV1 TaxID=631454 RepID=V4T8W5_9HYPH|nr:YeaH/YhbH family protein [Lutibaculum baratangense]ESR22988.1 hypothetical protein N177_3056 [Lutibaculum baratangense AMV1]
MRIIDRRRDTVGKSLPNRQRFVRRARDLLRRAVKEASAARGIREADEGGAVTIPADAVREPTFRASPSGGHREHVLPGNRDFVVGDRIASPPRGGGGSGGSPDGEGEDPFSFVLSREEFLDLYFEDLELPNMAKRHLLGEHRETRRPAGYQTSGPPGALSVGRTLRKSLSRRVALRRPKREELLRLRQQLEEMIAGDAGEERIEKLRTRIEAEEARAKRISFIDPVDLRFRRTEAVPEPIARAVMFCLMDVSASMDEEMKDLAKRFFSLLYIFLKRRYRQVDVVFIRHTQEAKEVDEDTFFHSRESGGTVVSSALREMARIVEDRYPPHEWNIYAAQASDGENFSSDNAATVDLLRGTILPLTQYYAYIEIGRGPEARSQMSTLWNAYDGILAPGMPMAMRRVSDRRDIYPVFRQFFERAPGRTGS